MKHVNEILREAIGDLCVKPQKGVKEGESCVRNNITLANQIFSNSQNERSNGPQLHRQDND